MTVRKLQDVWSLFLCRPQGKENEQTLLLDGHKEPGTRVVGRLVPEINRPHESALDGLKGFIRVDGCDLP